MSLNKIKPHSYIWNMFFRQTMKNRYNSFSFAERLEKDEQKLDLICDAEANKTVDNTHRKSYFSAACLFQFIFSSNSCINVCHEQIPFHTFYFIWYSRVSNLGTFPAFRRVWFAAEDTWQNKETCKGYTKIRCFESNSGRIYIKATPYSPDHKKIFIITLLVLWKCHAVIISDPEVGNALKPCKNRSFSFSYKSSFFSYEKLHFLACVRRNITSRKTWSTLERGYYYRTTPSFRLSVL